jgi:hypothetical protein
MSTLYIPPQRRPELDQEMVVRLGLAPRPAPADAAEKPLPPVPRLYEETPPRSALANFILSTATEPDLLLRFESDPLAVARATPLSDEERGALLTRMPGRIWAAIKHAPTVESTAD